ncbi:YfbK domain-containing protein [Prosthecobacter dejongeii]|uniref:Secreted protein with Ig-like and vWFA domain n=1 Tax=Prosthecobacter dejongeii TaxID=48465 RepID=A0A7W7YLA5_9BACT|nr:von Willebrand factor type A domain-containing protein [Prosthecobacter dejongeii]MBB5038318.1 secreted protein with Ig-like and vWFA domain [Prosthecobacter dejongeii]
MKPEQITAWALNELSAEERAQIEALIQEDAEASTQASQTKGFCDFLTAELGDDSLAFTPEQRERLSRADAPAASFPNEAPQPALPKQPTFWRRHVFMNLAAAAAVVMGTTLFIRKQMESEGQMAEITPTVRGNLGDDQTIITRTSPVPEEPAPVVAAAPPTSMRKLQANAAPLMKQDESTLAAKDAKAAMTFSNMPETKAKNEATMVDAEAARREYFAATQDQQRARLLNQANEPWESPAPTTASVAPGQVAATPAAAPKPAAPVANGNITVNGGSLTITGAGTLTLQGRTTYTGGVVRSAPSSVTLIAGSGMAGNADIMDGETQMRRSQESYTQIIENALKSVESEPLSTFSIDVDTASYANVRRFLNQNSAPPRDAVRIEELINYFPMDEKGPAAGVKEPFAVKVEMAACPWQPQHRLARIAIKGKQIGLDRQPSNLVFLVDVSGSMAEPNKLPLVQQSLRMLAGQLGENDRVSMVTYANGSQVVLSSTTGQNKGEIVSAIDRLQAGGGTHGSAGIRLAYEQAVAGFIKGGVNRVVLCTDGDFNVGISSPTELETFISEKARSGVFLSVLGYGSGNLKDRTMETLADKGNGNYAYIDSLGEARKVLVEQMNGTLVTIAKDVKIQVEFNPAVIRSYRLIGYENRLLAKEDFNDDAKDAGEIGAGHSVTALYELVPANLPPGGGTLPQVDALKYQQPITPAVPMAATAAATDEALTVKLRYKEPEGNTSSLIEVPVKDNSRAMDTASGEFKFTTAVAGFGLLLRQSSYAGQLTWDQVRQLALEGKGTDALGYRGEFIQLIEKARGVSR